MRVRGPFDLPREKQRVRHKADRIEWITLPVQLSVVVVLYFVLGNSQAMKAAWIDDLLAFVPPIAYLVARHFTEKEPNQRFPYGYYRMVTVAYLTAAAVITWVGASLLYDSFAKLVGQEHTPIGTIDIFGWRIWLGYLMIVGLLYSIVTEVILGRIKLEPAKELHNKVLYADAEMNKAGWLSESAAVVGIIGIGFGLWWADPVAAIVIAVDIVYDGIQNLSQAVRDLADQEPRKVGTGKPDPVVEELRASAERLGWVSEAAVRLREEGEVLSGEVFVVPRIEVGLVPKIEEAVDDLKKVNWRIYDLTIMPVSRIERSGPAEGKEQRSRSGGSEGVGSSG